jgi:hypothetical protein
MDDRPCLSVVSAVVAVLSLKDVAVAVQPTTGAM